MDSLGVNDLILLTIKRLGINGEGIAYYKRKAVFVEGGIPGEVVEVRITDIQDKYIVGEITKQKKTSPARIKPDCPYFGKCGGCTLQHISYPMQLNEKQNMVIEAFNRYFDGDVSKIKFKEPIGAKHLYNYRNKTSLPLRFDGQKVVSGLYAKDSNKLVYVDECLLESKIVQNTLKEVLVFLTRHNASIYNPHLHQGIIREVVIRGFNDSGEVQVTFILTKEDKQTISYLKKFPCDSVNISINDDFKSIDIFGKNVINIAGKEKIDGSLNNLHFSISPKAFFQLNIEQTLVLYDKIKEVAGLDGSQKVLDCYCGIGTIGMSVSKDALEVRGIDINKDGIEDANNFAKLNGIKNAKFYSGNILPHLEQFKQKGFVPDVLIVDPPRKGLDLNLIRYLQNSDIKKIIYVSCNPSTLVKNINHLSKKYVVKSVDTIDLMPQTSHVETIALLSLKVSTKNNDL